MWLFLLMLCLLPFIAGGLSLAPWVPTFSSDRVRLGEILPLGKKRFLELGCGAGGVSLFVSKHFPDYQVTGIEINPLLFCFSCLRAKLSGQKNLHMRFGNGLLLDFSNYDIVYIYGLPETLVSKILPKYQHELPNLGLLISYTFSFSPEFVGERLSHRLEKRNTIHTLAKK